MGNVSLMEQAEHREDVAKLYAEGKTRQEIAEVYDVHPDTVTTWKRRADVQQLITKYQQERVNRILRHTDTRIEKWLESEAGKNADIETLLKVRKEFVPERIDLNVSGDESAAVQELMTALHNNPAFAKAMAELDESGQ